MKLISNLRHTAYDSLPILRPTDYCLRTKKGFTLIEILIMLGIMSMLSGVMLVYSRSSEKLVVLAREQARIISLMARAKSFSLQTYIDGTSACGYGIHIDKGENAIIVFRDLDADCPESDNIYAADSDESVEKFILSKDVRIKSSDATDILFIPPDPQVVIDNNPVNERVNIVLETSDGNSQVVIKMNSSGQITTQ